MYMPSIPITTELWSFPQNSFQITTMLGIAWVVSPFSVSVQVVVYLQSVNVVHCIWQDPSPNFSRNWERRQGVSGAKECHRDTKKTVCSADDWFACLRVLERQLTFACDHQSDAFRRWFNLLSLLVSEQELH